VNYVHSLQVICELIQSLSVMGKKEGKKREREVEEEEEEAVDPELQAELNAIMAMRSEQQQKALNITSEGVSEGVSGGTYNREAMLQFCESMGTEELPFVETLQVSQFDLDVQDDHDDLEREMSFYNHALAAVNVGRTKLTDLGVKFRRPDDFFCESIKSDAHMARVSYSLYNTQSLSHSITQLLRSLLYISSCLYCVDQGQAHIRREENFSL
jgi:rRNA-processing protein EBP2